MKNVNIVKKNREKDFIFREHKLRKNTLFQVTIDIDDNGFPVGLHI